MSHPKQLLLPVKYFLALQRAYSHPLSLNLYGLYENNWHYYTNTSFGKRNESDYLEKVIDPETDNECTGYIKINN